MDVITNPPINPFSSASQAAANAAAVANLDTVTGIDPLNPAVVTPAVDLTPLNSTTVDLSPLGQFLSSLSLSRKTLTQLQGAATADTPQTAAGNSNAEAVTAAAQNLADAFNALQTPVVGTGQAAIDLLANENADTPFSQDAQLSQIQPQGQTAAQLQAQQALQSLQTTNGGAASPLDNLAQLGVGLQTSPLAAGANTLVVDQQALQAAFANNPARTVDALSQAATALNAFGTGLLQQNADAVAQANDIAVLDSASGQALQQAATLRADFANAAQHPQDLSNNGLNQSAADASQAIPQTTLADMALTDLLGESQAAAQEQQLNTAAIDAANVRNTPLDATRNANTVTAAQTQQNTQLDQAIAAQQQSQADALSVVNTTAANQAITAAAANTALLNQTAANQAVADRTAADRTTADQLAAAEVANTVANTAANTATEQRQADTVLEAQQAAQLAQQQAIGQAAQQAVQQAAQQTGNAAVVNAQVAAQANQAQLAAVNIAQAANQGGIDEANRLARDPAIAAAIAAYHLGDVAPHMDAARHALAAEAQRQIVAPVTPVTRVEPAEKV